MTSLVFGSLLFLSVYYARDPIDKWLIAKFRSVLSKKPIEEENVILWLQHLMRNIRSGQTLTQGLEDFAKANSQNPYRTESEKILRSQTTTNPISTFLQESIRGGAPTLQPLQFFHRKLEQQMRTKRRARALTAQSRLQATVIFFAPWALLATMSVSNPEMAAAALHSSTCQAIWFGALMMNFCGFIWIQKILRSALLPRTEEEKITEELLPQFLLHTYTRILSGLPIEEAAARSIPHQAPPIFQKIFSDIFSPCNPLDPLLLTETKELLQAAAKQGFSLKQEIESALAESESKRDARIEEALQRLPIKILAPLFLFILPSALLILFSFIFPALNQWS